MLKTSIYKPNNNGNSINNHQYHLFCKYLVLSWKKFDIHKLLKDYRDILRIAIEQEKLLKKAIEICRAKDGMKTAKEKEVENGR